MKIIGEQLKVLDLYELISYTVRVRGKVDETTSKLVRQLRVLELKQREVEADIEAIQRALELAGVKPNEREVATAESYYAKNRPFKNATLVNACLRILKDTAEGDGWLTKSEIEYLVSRGGFEFSAKDSKNSVDVTLRRLVADDRCEVVLSKGKVGNKYRFKVKEDAAP